ncbi:Flp pilus assembly protein CpaB [Oceanicella actignis]|uniref:Flp pilus assembly protein CpaB n=1 Tax=Oceanicella actignis TaxID=1189325 RepID=UPI0011E85F4F|nr:Flp pilus assembly protein CpaB [Oceanicella actignis]TYO88216.1 pilus assembly protein CpaB [Oceanicella actignis]
MRMIAILVLLAGFALAGGSVYYMYGMFKQAQAQLAQQPKIRTIPTVKIAVAAKDLRYGEPLTEKSVRMVEWPKNAAPANGFQRLEDLFVKGGEPRTVLRRMEPNEPILKSKVTGFGEKATVAALLDPGMRAHTFQVNAVSSIGGFMLPGTRIDVILTYKDRNEGIKTKYLMQNIEVIAVDQDTDRDRIDARVARTVTVQVTPRQVEQLTLAQSLGKITLALRGFGAQDVSDAEGITREDLLGDEPEAVADAPAAPEPEELKVKVRRGAAELQSVTVE